MIERIQTSMLKIHKTNKSKLFIAQTEPSSNLSRQTLPKLTTSSGLPSLKTTSPLTQKKRCELAAYIFKKSLDSLRAKVQTTYLTQLLGFKRHGSPDNRTSSITSFDSRPKNPGGSHLGWFGKQPGIFGKQPGLVWGNKKRRIHGNYLGYLYHNE